jgi:hypothetical protein
MEIKPIPKLLVVAVFAESGTLFERRVALGPAREPTSWPSGRSAAGFRRLGGRHQVCQKRLFRQDLRYERLVRDHE